MESSIRPGGHSKYDTEWVCAPVTIQHGLPDQKILTCREDGKG